MALAPAEHIKQFDMAIYYPMLISILERDRETFEKGPFKLKGPYLKLIDGALKAVRADQKESNAYMRSNKLKVLRRDNDGTFTEYIFIHGGYEDKRRYLNHRLRNRTEELMNMYFAMAEIN